MRKRIFYILTVCAVCLTLVILSLLNTGCVLGDVCKAAIP